MDEYKADLLLIKSKFPDETARIDELYAIDMEFRALCADYFLTTQNLEELQEECREILNDLKQYQEICKELELEIKDYIAL